MLIPRREINIYPNNEENVRAILDYYFKIPDNDTKWIFEQKDLTINQVEFIAKKVSNNIEFFKINIPNGIDISNLMHYGFDALTKIKSDWKGSKERLRIIREFRDLVEKDSDFDFRNN